MTMIRQVVDEQGNVLREEIIQEQSPWMTIQDAARYLDVTEHTIHEYNRTRKPNGERMLRKYRIGDFRTIRLARSEVEALVQPMPEDEGLADIEEDVPVRPDPAGNLVDVEEAPIRPHDRGRNYGNVGPHGPYPSGRIPGQVKNRSSGAVPTARQVTEPDPYETNEA